MTATEKDLLQALLELEDAVVRIHSDPMPDLRSLIGRLDRLTDRLPPNTPPELRHYLQKKSYQKARYFLQGRDPEAGSCGH